MFVKSSFKVITIVLMVWGITYAQNDNGYYTRNLGGPRLGVTVVPGNGKLAQKLEEKNIGRLLSQFGWHFESQVSVSIGGPSFVLQFVPLFAGVEYGTLIPSMTLAMGVRLPNGVEFGMGPNLLIGGDNIVNSSLVIGFGKSFDYGGVSIPVNIVWATNPAGNRFSVIIGYAIGKTKSR